MKSHITVPPNVSRSEIKEQFRAALVALVNEKIKATGLRPEEAAEIFAEEAQDALGYLAWLPHPQRAAREHLVSAAACLRDGRVIPVPGFEILFPEHAPEASSGIH